MALLDLFAFWIYRSFLVPLALLLLFLFRPFLPKKLQETWQDRQNLVFQPLPSRPLWVHASSGEIEYAKPVIRELREQFPQCNILVTYFSPSAKPLIAKISGVDLVLPLPFDQRFAVCDFLEFYKPQSALFARTDVWPEMSYQLRKRKIPSLLFAATLAEQSSRSRFPGKLLTRFAFNNLSEIQCVANEDLQTLQSLPVSSEVLISGDTRYDQIKYRLESEPAKIPLAMIPAKSPTQKIFVMGSTWSEDENELMPAIQKWVEWGQRAIIVPHEVDHEHIAGLSKNLKKYNIIYNIYSQTKTWNSPVLVVDRIGILQELYKLADIAFVGGSFKGKVHSVMEALCIGIPVLLGPHMKNNREAIQFSKIPLRKIESQEETSTASSHAQAVTVCENAPALVLSLREFLERPTESTHLLTEIQSRLGASQRVISWIRQVLR